MKKIQQWWSHHRLTVAGAGLAIAGAWVIRQTHGAFLVESYRWITQPWQPTPETQTRLDTAVNRELKAKVAELEYQNQELKRLLQFTDQITGNGIPAPVVARAADHWWQQLTLGRGQLQGVKSGDVVMAPGGLVGRIQHVTSHTSRVLLISDPTSRVGVMLSRTRVMGVLRGTGSQESILEFFEKDPVVEVGDPVVTSGLSSLYPAGVMVGHVQSINLEASPAPQAVIELNAPLGLIEWGLIYAYATSTP